MKKYILKIISIAFCLCVMSAQISAQVLADPGNDPLADSSPVTESLASSGGNTLAFKNGTINAGTRHDIVALNRKYGYISEPSAGQKRKR